MSTPLILWSKLNSLYSMVSIFNLVFLKSMLFNYKIDGSKSINEKIDELLNDFSVKRHILSFR